MNLPPVDVDVYVLIEFVVGLFAALLLCIFWGVRLGMNRTNRLLEQLVRQEKPTRGGVS